MLPNEVVSEALMRFIVDELEAAHGEGSAPGVQDVVGPRRDLMRNFRELDTKMIVACAQQFHNA